MIIYDEQVVVIVVDADVTSTRSPRLLAHPPHSLALAVDSSPGSFVTAAGVSPCPIGSYSTVPNAESCEMCPANFSTESAGSSSMDACKRK